MGTGPESEDKQAELKEAIRATEEDCQRIQKKLAEIRKMRETQERKESQEAVALEVEPRPKVVPLPLLPLESATAKRGSVPGTSREMTTRSKLLCHALATPGEISQARRKSVVQPKVEEPMDCLACLRGQFQRNDADESGDINRHELLDLMESSLIVNSGPLDAPMKELLEEVVRRRFAEFHLGVNVADTKIVTESEWVHYMMLQSMAPSYIAARSLNDRLRKKLETHPSLLDNIQRAFSQADKDGDGFLSPACAKVAFEAASTGLRQFHPGGDAFDGNLDGKIDYFEFVSHVLGDKLHSVELAMYDLSHGKAALIPAMLLDGHKFEGVWHTGVRVFGFEYWYGGGLFQQRPECVPFGRPTKIVELGSTLMSHQELTSFVARELSTTFSPNNYDVLRNNCNCFSNEVVQYLLNGTQIPEEVREQPSLAQHSCILQMSRAALNKWLGGFGDGREGACTRIDDLTTEWRQRLQAGDMVLHREHWIDSPYEAIITKVKEDRTMDLVFFRPSGGNFTGVGSIELDSERSWEVAQKFDTPVEQIFPCLEPTTGATSLKIDGATHGRAGMILRRACISPEHPFCEKGHQLEPGASSWIHVPPCSLCASVTDGGRMHCPKCQFELCGKCVEDGLALQVFTDLITPGLAKDLLENPLWMTFMSHFYFHKADVSCKGSVSVSEIRWFADSVCLAMDVPRVSDEALNHEIFEISPIAQRVPMSEFESIFVTVIGGVNDGSETRIPFSDSVHFPVKR